MSASQSGMRLSDAELAHAFSDPTWSQRFPPVLTVDQAAELLTVPKATIYDWSSRGLLQDCARRVGKYLRFFRDRLLKQIFNKGLASEK